jgi:type IV pilus assembly protein PilX
MKARYNNAAPRSAARGMALITSLLLLLIITLLALSMFRSFGIQGRIAGNTREKERALHAAEAAQQYAEYWLMNNSGTVSDTACTSTANNWLNANGNQGQICSNPLASVTTVPWTAGGGPVGVYYNPGFQLDQQAAGAVANSVAQLPVFYIADLGAIPTGCGAGSTCSELYQIDAVGYGGNSNTVAVVESTFEVGSGVTCFAPCQSGSP